MSDNDLKQRTLTGLFWSFADNIAAQGINFIIGVILARMLAPKDFGLFGMIIVFITVAQNFVDGGFSQALIRKKDCDQNDYCTVFYFNLFIGILLYGILFCLAGPISHFFNQPSLEKMVPVLGLVLIINAAGLIQNTVLIKNINFKLQTKISIISSIFSGIVSIGLAYQGWGVWSLVWKMLVQNSLQILLLWWWNAWRPAFIFSLVSLRSMFGFGSKLLAAELINRTYNSVYYLIIGRFYSAVDLGYYVWSDNCQNLFSSNLTAIVQRVSYPVLSSIQDDNMRLKIYYKELIKNTMLISFVLLVGLAATAKQFIFILVGAKWLEAVPYLQLLCFVGMLYPLHALNLNMLNVKGRSDLFLKLEFIKDLLSIPVILIGVFIGIKAMLIGMIIHSIIAYFINSFWSGRLIDYPMGEQVGDIAPIFFSAVMMGSCVYILGRSLPYNALIILSAQVTVGALMVTAFAHIFRLGSYGDIKQILVDNILIKKSH